MRQGKGAKALWYASPGPTGVMSTADLLPFERVQIDHTRIDVVVVNEGDRLPIGRPWLTLAIDVASRVVLGFSVSLEGPSVVSVALTLVHAVLAKDLWLADRQLRCLGLCGVCPSFLQIPKHSFWISCRKNGV